MSRASLSPRARDFSDPDAEGWLVSYADLITLLFIFFALIMIQGFYAGKLIGKFREGSLKQGLLHSLILMTVSALLITTIKGCI